MRALSGLLRRAAYWRRRRSLNAASELESRVGFCDAGESFAREFARSRWKAMLPRHTTEPKKSPWRPKPPQHQRPRRKQSRFQLVTAKKIIDEWDVVKSEDEDEEVRKSRNERRREAARALQMAKLLSTFTKRQIRDAVKYAFLPNETLQAAVVFQKLKEEGVHEGKRRQLSYIARLIRTAEPNLVEFVFNSLRDGHTQKMKKVIEAATATERDKQVQLTTENWVRGLLNKDEEVMKQIYMLPPDQVDRAELRRLIQDVRANAARKDKTAANDPLQGFMHTSLWRAKKALTKFVSKAALYDYNTRAALAQKEDREYLEDHPALVEAANAQDAEADEFINQSASEFLDSGSSSGRPAEDEKQQG